MDKLKAVFFDFDGVMTTDKNGTKSICNYISKNTGIDKNILEIEYRKYNHDLQMGKITHEEIWDEICNNIGVKIPIKTLHDSFIHTPIDNEMYEIILKIKNQNIKTGLITDNKTDRIQYINEKYDLNKYFDIISVSGELGYGKESEKIFIYTLEKLGVEPKESLFIDNQERNLIIPNKMGIITYYFDDTERDIDKLKNELKKYSISV